MVRKAAMIALVGAVGIGVFLAGRFLLPIPDQIRPQPCAAQVPDVTEVPQPSPQNSHDEAEPEIVSKSDSVEIAAPQIVSPKRSALLRQSTIQSRGAAWGMSQAEVMALEDCPPASRSETDLFYFDLPENDETISIQYVFQNRELVEIIKFSLQASATAEMHRTRYDEAVLALAKLYGPPVAMLDKWSLDRVHDDPRGWETFLASSDVADYAVWMTRDARISISLGDSKSGAAVIERYARRP